MEWGYGGGAGIRSGLKETRGAHIPGPTNFSPNTAPLQFPQLVWGKAKEVAGQWQGTWEEERAMLEMMPSILDIVSLRCLAGEGGQDCRLDSIPNPSIS